MIDKSLWKTFIPQTCSDAGEEQNAVPEKEGNKGTGPDNGWETGLG